MNMHTNIMETCEHAWENDNGVAACRKCKRREFWYAVASALQARLTTAQNQIKLLKGGR